jgi:phosphoglycerate dehydrogenase-like enzyme
LAEGLLDAEVALFGGAVDPTKFTTRHLRWAHCDQSGLDAIAAPELVASPIAATSSAGRSAPVLAEHVLFFMLAVSYRFDHLRRNQKRRLWKSKDFADHRGLFGKNVLIVGMGHTGKAVAGYCLALGPNGRGPAIRVQRLVAKSWGQVGRIFG